MAKYEIKEFVGSYIILNTETKQWFEGYDFMGGQEWSDLSISAYEMDEQEALQIKADLEAAE